jgi:hypothetical protein
MSTGRRKWWLCVAPVCVCLIDVAATLYYQPAAYWSGQFDQVSELSPIDRWMLMQHPLAFAGWVVTWMTGFSVVIRYVPTPISLIAALALMFGNAAGTNSWLSSRIPNGFWICYALFLAIAALVVITWRKAGVLSRSER